MKCNIKKKNTYSKVSNLSHKKENPETIDLNNYLYHGIGTYIDQDEKLDRLKAIIDSRSILSENLQPNMFERSNKLSRSPKCNGKDCVSICQRQSFVNSQDISDSFNLYISSGLSIILDKEILKLQNIQNQFDPNNKWEWLDGEYRVKDQIQSSYFVGIGFPCRSIDDEVQALKSLYKYSLQQCLEHFDKKQWYWDLCAIKNFMDYYDLEIPIFSITSGKEMGNLYSSISETYNVSVDEITKVYHNKQTNISDRIGIVRNWESRWQPSCDETQYEAE